MSFDVSSTEWAPKILDSKILTAVDFWAPWCPWCTKLKPIFEELAKDYPNRIMFAKVNVGTESTIAASLGIMSIPVIKFFCYGKEVGELVGYMPKEILKQKIDEMLQNHKQCLEQSSSLKH